LRFKERGEEKMGAKNKVIAGDYLNRPITCFFGIINIAASLKESILIDKTTVEEYEIVNEEKQKSAASAVSRGLVGGLILGPVGLLAGLSAKSKGIHTIAIQFKSGEKSLIEVDDKIYKELIKKLF
jgi:hypothetical protein